MDNHSMDNRWTLNNYWIPEALPDHPAVYAPHDYKAGKNTMTSDAWKAMRFTSEKDCQTWCEANPIPIFIPVCHGFTEELTNE